MDDFLREHTVKKRIADVAPNRKSQLKYTLKLMLNGYERNDTSAIRKAEERRGLEDDIDIALGDSSDDQKAKEFKGSTAQRVTTSIQRAAKTHVDLHVHCPNNQYEEKAYFPKMMDTSRGIHSSKLNSDKSSSLSNDNSDAVAESVNNTSESSEESLESVYYSANGCTQSTDGCDNNFRNSYVDSNSSKNIQKHSQQKKCSRKRQKKIHYSTPKLEETNGTMSIYEFDAEGDLATKILDKLITDKRACDKLEVLDSCESDCITDMAPSMAGYTKVSRKKKSLLRSKSNNLNQSLLRNDIDRQQDKKVRIPIYVSLDASMEDLPGWKPFQEYNFSTSKILAPKTISFKDVQFTKCLDVVDDSDSDLSQISCGESGHTLCKTVRSTPGDTMDELDDSTLPEFDNTMESAMNSEPSDIEETSVPLQFHCVQDGVVVVLQHPSEVYFYGKAKITSLCGTVEIMGYKLNESTIEVFAPRFSYAQSMKTVANECSYIGLFHKLTSLGIPTLTTENIVVSLKEFGSILFMEHLDRKDLEFVENEFGSLEMFHMSKRTLAVEEHYDVAKKLSCSINGTKPQKIFKENPGWPEITKYSQGPCRFLSKGIICGGKGTGKSTFLQYYINSMVSSGSVLLIDIDPGQAELTPPGCLSVTVLNQPIIGPNFTHLHTPHRMLNIGMINVLDNVERYLSAVRELLEFVTEQRQFQNIPWIVNTMGMSNSLGLKIITYIILLLNPTLLVQTDSEIQSKCFEMLLTREEIERVYMENYDDAMFENVRLPEGFGYRYFMLSRQKLPKEVLTAKDKRYISFLSYFGKTVPKSAEGLLGVRPYIVPMKSVKMITTCEVDENAIASVINGKIVALCEDHTNFEGKALSTIQYEALVCLGYGLIRGVDLETDSLFIITSERDSLPWVKALLYSESYPEMILSEAGLAAGTMVPYRASLHPHNKRLLIAPKRRFNPLQLLRMKQKSM